MRKDYVSPELLSFGTVAALTGIEGDPNAQDFVYNSSGVVIIGPMQGSIDADPCGVPSDPECGEGLGF